MTGMPWEVPVPRMVISSCMGLLLAGSWWRAAGARRGLRSPPPPRNSYALWRLGAPGHYFPAPPPGQARPPPRPGRGRRFAVRTLLRQDPEPAHGPGEALVGRGAANPQHFGHLPEGHPLLQV